MARLWYDKGSTASFTKRSQEIFNVFTKTQEECEQLNSEIAKEVTSKEEEIKRLQQEAFDLNQIRIKNDSLAKKIQAFINS